MKRIHFFSGVVISLFILLHLFNHLISLFGPSAHIEVMTSLRQFYRHFIMEFLLSLAVLIQIISGIKLVLIKRKTTLSFWPKLQLYAGVYLGFFLLIHLGAVWAGRLILALDTNFYFGVAGLNTFPINLFFIPYYSLAIMAVFGHFSAIHAQKMTKPFLHLSPNQQARFILYFGIGLTLLIIFGLTNGFKGVAIPEAYHVLVGK